MFVPLKDDNPLKLIRFQYVSLALIVVNVLVFLLSSPLQGDVALAALITGYGVVPSEILATTRNVVAELNPVAEPVTLFTYMFVHADWLHLLTNMAFLWVFADNVEDAFGHLGFALFFVLCGIVAALVHVVMLSNSHDPLVGASGAVSGVLAAYLLLYPKARVWILLFFRIPLKIPAWIVLGGWIILQFFMLTQLGGEAENVAWWAHIGGFAMGTIFTLILRSPLVVKPHSQA